MKIKCGNANPNGNIALFYKGGCKKELKIEDAYRCTGCGGWFHIECILEHFRLEQKHDVGRNNLKEDIKGILRKIIKKEFPKGKRKWCFECAKRIKKDILIEIDKL